MFCLSPSTLIINVFSFLIKIGLFYWSFIWKHTISQVLSKAAIQSDELLSLMDWNGKEEGFFVEWLSYFVLFTDRFSFAIVGSHPHFILSTPKKTKSLHRKINAFLFLSQKSMHPIFRFLAFFLWISFKIFITVCLFFIWCVTHFETK